MSEFGRTPGLLSETRKGREHYMHVHSGMFANFKPAQEIFA